MRSLGTNGSSELFVAPPQRNVPFPLVREVALPFVVNAPEETRVEVDRRLEEYPRGRPWLRIVSIDRSDDRLQVTLERFIGISAAHLIAELTKRKRLLPLATWATLFDEVLGAIDSFPRRNGMFSPFSFGWSITGELTFSLSEVNSVLADAYPHIGRHRTRYASFSPEAVRGRPITSASTVFVAAAVGSHLLSGRAPFRKSTDIATLDALRTGAFDPIDHPEYGPALDAFFRRCLAREPADRFPDVAATRTALRQAVPFEARSDAFGQVLLAGEGHFREILEQLKAEPELLPEAWQGLYAAGTTARDGLAVWEDRFLEFTGAVR